MILLLGVGSFVCYKLYDYCTRSAVKARATTGNNRRNRKGRKPTKQRRKFTLEEEQAFLHANNTYDSHLASYQVSMK